MRILRWLWMMVLPFLASGQKKWDGGAGTSNWMDATNWYPDGIPLVIDSIEFDNSILPGSYKVLLPSGNTSVEIRKILIRASAGKEITVEIPTSSVAVPALNLTDTKDALIIDQGGVFINASTADSLNPLQLNGSLRIQHAGRYIHRTLRGNAYLTGKLSTALGTETGYFEFDVPGNANNIVSLTGKTFGHLIFSANQAGTKNYQANGSNNCTILGNLEIKTGAKFQSLFTSDILLYGNVVVDGSLLLKPSTLANTGRSVLVFNNSIWSGKGTIELNSNFRQIEVRPSALMELNIPINLPFDSNKLIIKGRIDLPNASLLTGDGAFILEDGGGLAIYNTEGICKNCLSSPVKTKIQQYSNKGNYYFLGTSIQQTGVDLPDTIQSLSIQNNIGVNVDHSIFIRDSLLFQNGKLTTDETHIIHVAAGGIKQYSNLSYIDGPIRILVKDTLTHKIPIGDQMNYAPVFVRASAFSLNTSIDLKYNPDKDPAVGISYWKLSSLDPNKKIYFGSIPQKKDSMQGIGPIETLLNENGNWAMTNTQQKIIDGAMGLESVDPISSVSKIAIRQQQDQVLPLDRVLLKGYSKQGFALLSLNIVGQDELINIQRSKDGIDFQNVGSVMPTKSSIIYWEDPILLTQTVFYRAMFKKNESPAFSNVIRLSPVNQKEVRLYPNPAQEKIFIIFKNPCSKTEYRIVNSSGTLVRKLPSNNAMLDISALVSGSYLLQIVGCDQINALPFTKN